MAEKSKEPTAKSAADKQYEIEILPNIVKNSIEAKENSSVTLNLVNTFKYENYYDLSKFKVSLLIYLNSMPVNYSVNGIM